MSYGDGGKAMAIKLIEDQPLWDRFVDRSPTGFVFHKWHFLKLLERYTAFRLLPYGIYKGEELICLFPLFYKKLMGLKLLFSPPPKSGVPYIGPVLHWNYDSFKQDKKESHLNLIAREIDREIRRISPHYFEVSMPPGFIDVRSFINLGYGIITGFTYILDITPSIDDIWNRCSGECRNNIRKGLKNDYQLEENSDHLELVKFLSERYAEKGRNFLVNPEFIGEVLKAFPEAFAIYYLCNNGERVSGVFNLEQKGHVSGWLGMPKPRDSKDVYANEVFLWKLIQKASAEGFRTFEIAGANTPEISIFRNKFNPGLKVCFRLYKKDLIGRIAEQAYFRFIKTI